MKAKIWLGLVLFEEVQQRTHLDFFHDLPDAQEMELEAEPAESLWD